MDVDRRTDLPEELTSQRPSLSCNNLNCSQYKKISVGVLVDSISKADMKDLKKPMMQNAENEAYIKGNCVEHLEGHTPLMEKRVTVEQKGTSPWVSTRSGNTKRSSSVAVQDTEHTPSFTGVSRQLPRSKLLEKTSAAHSHKFLATKGGLEFDRCRQKKSGNDICFVMAGKGNDAEHADNIVFSNEPEVQPMLEQVEDKDRIIETGGCETLRVKLWEILGNVSSVEKPCPCPNYMELHPDRERDVKLNPVEKINLNSDTIENDSQTPAFTKTTSRSLTRRKASTKKQNDKAEATKSIRRKDCPQKRIFSFRGDRSGRYDYFDDGSLPSKRNKTQIMNSQVETCQGRQYENAEESLQSEKSRSIPTLENSLVHRRKSPAVRRSSKKRNDVHLEPKDCNENNTSSDPPFDLVTDKMDVQQSMHYEVSKKDGQKDLASFPVKIKSDTGHDPLEPPSECKSHGFMPISNQGKLHEQSPGCKIFNRSDIRSFKSLLTSKSSECKPSVRLEPSYNRFELNDSSSNSFLVKPSSLFDAGNENQVSKSLTDVTDSERSDSQSHKQDCGVSEELSSEKFLSENLPHCQDKNLSMDNDVEMSGCKPSSRSLKDGIQGKDELEMYLEQKHDHGLARAVTLFSVALNHLKTRMKSISSRRSGEILRASAEEIFLQLQNAESLIQADMGKLTNMSHLKRKQLENQFQEQQDQLLGIFKRFKEEVDQHLQDYGSLIEDLEEHEMELKRSLEKKRADHKKVIARVEQEIGVQLDGAESKILAVQELAREKMLQLKLGLAECLKHGVLG